MIMINESDFKGKWLVAQNNYTQLQPYIDRYEEQILKELMGDTLFADFDSDPLDPKWDDLKAVGFGLTSLVVGFVYFEYVRDLPFRVTNMGVVYQMDENSSQVVSFLALRQRYNECVTDYCKMQKLLKSEFADFNGKRRKYLIN